MKESYSKQNRELVIFKMLANANRLKILRSLIGATEGKLTVSEIATQTHLSMPKTSDHLKLLRINKILRAEQSGNMMFYSLRDPLVIKLLS